MYKVDFRDLLNNQKVSTWFSVVQVQRESKTIYKKNTGKNFKKDSEKW